MAIMSSAVKPLKLMSTCIMVMFLMKVFRHFQAGSEHSNLSSWWRKSIPTSNSFLGSLATHTRRVAPPPTPPSELKDKSRIFTCLFYLRDLASAMAPLALILFQWSSKVSKNSLFSMNLATVKAPISEMRFFEALNSFSVKIMPDS